jgi:hypothetical protein
LHRTVKTAEHEAAITTAKRLLDGRDMEYGREPEGLTNDPTENDQASASGR